MPNSLNKNPSGRQEDVLLSVDEALQQAVAHHQAGKLAEAEQLYRAILEAQSNHPDANHNLGILAGQVGQSAAGLPYLKVALASHPDNRQYLLSYAEALLATGKATEALNILQSAMQRGLNSFAIQALRQKAEGSVRGGHANDPDPLPQADCAQLIALFNAGRHAELEDHVRLLLEQFPASGFAWKVLGASLKMQGQYAIHAMQKATELLPGDAEAHHNLGLALKEFGQLDEAVASYRRVLLINPAVAEVHSSLGHALKDLGQFDEAMASYRRSLEINPDFAVAHGGLGVVLGSLGQIRDAVASFRKAVEITPGSAEAHYNLGKALKEFGQLDEAVASYRRALEIRIDYADAHYNLGNTLKELGQYGEAAASYRRALEINPDFAEAHYNLGNTLKDLGQLSEAVACHRQALKIKPDYAEAYCNLGNALGIVGQLDEALACYRRALEIKPDFADAHSNLIFSLDLAAGIDTAALQEERRRWSSAHAAPLSVTSTRSPHANRPDPDRRLRIGYVSGDFKEHSAAIAFGTMLTCFDPESFDLYAYSNSVTEDGHTRIFQRSVTHWRKIAGLSDIAVADLIRQDGIDILVDLSGHSCGNRLRVFARKPAPVQISAWGYAGGTGMKAMDVLFSDPVIVPRDEMTLYAEEVRYLPSVISSFFPNAFPAVNALPATTANGVVFGSFNRLVKLSAETFNTWAQILRAIPTSRLLLKTPELDDAATRARIVGQFSQAGIDPERITLLGGTPWQDHMASFNRIDISLDPFPQSGGITTLEGLMMGVPVITLRGNTFVGRGSASILTTLALNDWIAETPAQYVDIAIQKANNPVVLTELRQQLRDRLSSSIIGDSQSYVKAVEQEYRQLWREWCARQQANQLRIN